MRGSRVDYCSWKTRMSSVIIINIVLVDTFLNQKSGLVFPFKATCVQYRSLSVNSQHLEIHL